MLAWGGVFFLAGDLARTFAASPSAFPGLVEGEFLRVFDKIEQVGVGSRKLVLAKYAEGIVANHPIARMKAQLSSRHFRFRRILVANRHPKRAIALKHATDLAHPLPRPLKIFVRLKPIGILIVLVTNIKRRIGKGQID